MTKQHPFIGAVACVLCGRGVNDDIHKPPFDEYEPGDFQPFRSPIDMLTEQFPALLDMIIRTKRTEQVRSDIARIASALIISGKESANTAVDTACYLYERIEAATADWGVK